VVQLRTSLLNRRLDAGNAVPKVIVDHPDRRFQAIENIGGVAIGSGTHLLTLSPGGISNTCGFLFSKSDDFSGLLL
jgi:hypothetical protein